MITLFKWAVVNTSELEETLFQNNAVIAALEKQVSQLAKTLDNLRKESATVHQQMLEAQNEAAQVPVLQDTIANQDKHISALCKEVSNLQTENYDLNKEVLALQKTTFAELPQPEKPVASKGGRPRKSAAKVSA